ncbi:MAG TPA: carbohydrate kinase family protein [Myxococcota bacterium]|nr:carbohydrate kinase family protein [Myxococcota bacterium]HRY94525.1 carbohydrate kinase family protein [Myxococcota bacterium]HSA20024.1 carbohydrate kinase family protein [Myxococcota bacterium]
MPSELVCLGNLVVDDVVFPDGGTRVGQAGGAVLYVALGAAAWGARVAVVAPVGEDYPAEALAALAGRGVDLSGLRPLCRPGLRAWLVYAPEGRRIVPREGRPGHAEGSPGPADLACAAARGARIYHLAPQPRASQAALVAALARERGALLSLDPCEQVTPATLGAWGETLAGVDVFLANEEELRLPGAGEEPLRALRAAAGGRLRQVLWKLGARGGLLHDGALGVSTPWAARAAAVVDVTGAGDAFAGGFLAGLLAGEPPAAALERGVVSASFALEGWGPAGLLAATPAAARARRAAWFGAA